MPAVPPAPAPPLTRKPVLPLARVIEMNLGFLGLQFSFGLQQGNMVPIYAWLGADAARMPMLQLAGPVTGLLIQPLIGALSDRTRSRHGRRTPWMLVGAVVCSVALLLMPFSASILMAASLLWLLDAGNNTTMEPYRAFVSDRLGPGQHALGFLAQSAFTGLAQCLAFLTPSLLVGWFGFDRDAVDSHNIPTITHVAFQVGAVLSLATLLWSLWRVPELPPDAADQARIVAAARSPGAALAEIWAAIRAMPRAMRQMAAMCLFQWYGFSIWWSYAALSLGRSIFHTGGGAGGAFREAVLLSQQLGAFYNLVAFGAAFAMVPLARRLGAARVHMAGLAAAGVAMLAVAGVSGGGGHPGAVFRAMAMPELGRHLPLLAVGLALGCGWASAMGLPYVILAGALPAARTGVYMGIFNMMIVIPMLLNSLTFGWIYRHALAGDPRHAVALAGALLIAAAVAMLWVREEAARGPAGGRG